MAEKIPRQKMPEQAPEKRRANFNEVNLGLSPETALLEASRCIQCKKPACVEGCPVRVDIPGFIREIKDGEFMKAFAVLKETNTLPAVCGRVCPQETQCEQVCILAKKGDPVGIGNLERFAADYERANGGSAPPAQVEPNGKRVAIIGSGPAGLTAAGELKRFGYEVTIFEALHSPGGCWSTASLSSACPRISSITKSAHSRRWV